MILKKGFRFIHICDNCFKESVNMTSIAPKVIVCRECVKKGIIRIDKINPIKRLKWYEVIYEYKEKGYELL